MARSAPKQNAGKRNSTVVVLLIVILIAVLLCAAGGYYLIARNNAKENRAQGGKREAAALQGSINQMTEEEIQQALNDIVEDGMFRISIASTIVAQQDGPAEMRIENKLQNQYIMQVTIYLTEQNENGETVITREIYRTDLIDPGYYIEADKFDVQIDPGEYDALAVFTAYYPDTEDIVGTAGAQVTIRVLPSGVTPMPTETPEPTPTVDPMATIEPSPTAAAK